MTETKPEPLAISKRLAKIILTTSSVGQSKSYDMLDLQRVAERIDPEIRPLVEALREIQSETEDREIYRMAQQALERLNQTREVTNV